MLATAPLTWVRLVIRSALQSRKWQLIGMSSTCPELLLGSGPAGSRTRDLSVPNTMCHQARNIHYSWRTSVTHLSSQCRQCQPLVPIISLQSSVTIETLLASVHHTHVHAGHTAVSTRSGLRCVSLHSHNTLWTVMKCIRTRNILDCDQSNVLLAHYFQF